ncbi:hypothetical protein QR98_0089860 [Sarcoptes scabiei]|uniref:Uncharacterized protein n=1 Tax=Sarcoptes scabiei TaxID=52283 RepID=A0A132AHF5_SARSC|nr:hypothetical protein QR98_0089860 [Sarcoptes scabiei]
MQQNRERIDRDGEADDVELLTNEIFFIHTEIRTNRYQEIREQIVSHLSDYNLFYDRSLCEKIDSKTKSNEDQSYESNFCIHDHHECFANNANEIEDLSESSGTNSNADPPKSWPLNYFLTLPTIRRLAGSLNDILKAFQLDNINEYLEKRNLHFDQEKMIVKRLKPFDKESIIKITNLTIYWEGFDSKLCDIALHLKDCLKIFGEIQSIRISRSSPGFCFAVFETQESSTMCLEYMRKFDENSAPINQEIREESNVDSVDNLAIKKSRLDVPTEIDNEMSVKLEKLKSKLELIRHTDYKHRFLSKTEWNRYKNRYLRLQKKSRQQMFIWHQKNQQIKESLDLALIQRKTLQERQQTGPNKEMLRKSIAHKEFHNIPKSHANVVCLKITDITTSKIDFSYVRKVIKQILNVVQTQSTNDLMNPNDLAYIDTSNRTMQFAIDCPLIQKIFLRIKNSRSAHKLISEEYFQSLRENLKFYGRLISAEVLNHTEVVQYWKTVASKKCLNCCHHRK